jgi:hypothetical protein
MRGHDLLAVQPHPHDRHLRAPIGIKGDQVRQGGGLQHGAG